MEDVTFDCVLVSFSNVYSTKCFCNPIKSKERKIDKILWQNVKPLFHLGSKFNYYSILFGCIEAFVFLLANVPMAQFIYSDMHKSLTKYGIYIKMSYEGHFWL